MTVRVGCTLIRLALLPAIFMTAVTEAVAGGIDGMAIEVGKSATPESLLTLTRVDLHRDWDSSWSLGGSTQASGYWDFSLGYWKNLSRYRTNREVFDLGVTPTFRVEKGEPISSRSPYAEIGVGLHLLSHSSVSPLRRFGGSFQFSEHLGAGIRFGTRRQFDVGYRFEHISNGGLRHPNKGITYGLVRFGTRF